VADGTHTYTAVATDSAGNTATSTINVTVNASTGRGNQGGGNGAGTGSTSGTSRPGVTGAGSGSIGTGVIDGDAAAVCGINKLVLTDIFPLRGRTHVLGVAPSGTAGRKVAIVSGWNGRVVARVKVRRDLSFTAAFRLPPRSVRATSRARYYARLGARKSRALKFARRLYNTNINLRGRKLSFSGVVVGPLARPARTVVIRGAQACTALGSGVVLARAKPSRTGAFRVTLTLPKSLAGLPFVFLRAQTVVRTSTRSRRSMPTFGLTRRLRVSA
jgi:hypothetical protein